MQFEVWYCIFFVCQSTPLRWLVVCMRTSTRYLFDLTGKNKVLCFEFGLLWHQLSFHHIENGTLHAISTETAENSFVIESREIVFFFLHKFFTVYLLKVPSNKSIHAEWIGRMCCRWLRISCPPRS